MTAARAVLAVALADARERTRRYGFLVTIAATIWIGYLVNIGWVALRVSGYRGISNSAWVGGQMAVIVSSLLTLVGFYLVKGSIERDHATGVGEILAATRLSRLQYAFGKLLSNAAVLASIVALLAAAAVVMQLAAREASRVDLAALLTPLALIAVPAMAMTAALAVLFESVRPLRGGLGNIVYFVVWTLLLLAAVGPGGAWDLTGISLLHGSMLDTLQAQHAGAGAAFTLKIQPPAAAATFEWSGLVWTSPVVAGRLLWIGLAAAATALAAALFDRFDPSRGGRRAAGGGASAPQPERAPTPARPAFTYRTLPAPAARFSFATLWLAECRLLLAGRSWWWLATAAGLLAGQILAPAPTHLHPWLVLAWIWPLLVWSESGCRRHRDRVDQVLLAAPSPLARQLVAEWLAGATHAAAVGAGALARMLAGRDLRGVAALLAGALAISALALALGTLTSGGKTFEIVWLVAWYVGPLQRASFLDVAGTTPTAVGRAAPAAVALAAAGLLAVAAIARRKRLRS